MFISQYMASSKIRPDLLRQKVAYSDETLNDESVFANWILLGDQFVNHMQKTGPKSDIFHGFWDLFLMKFEKFMFAVDGCNGTPHAYFLIDVQKSHFSSTFEKGPKIHVKCPIWVRFFACNSQIDSPTRSKCANHILTFRL